MLKGHSYKYFVEQSECSMYILGIIEKTKAIIGHHLDSVINLLTLETYFIVHSPFSGSSPSQVMTTVGVKVIPNLALILLTPHP